MGAISRQEDRIRHAVRLRRAERAARTREDILPVRTALETEIGPTVARATAARLLGVSQTALDRWIARGDIPTVVTRSGRRAVPRHALIELIEAVEERGRLAEERHPLASVLRERRTRAERSDVRSLLGDLEDRFHEVGHRAAELRGLAYHRAVAQALNDQVILDARDRLCRWRAEGRIDPRYARAWQEILELPTTQISQLIAEDTSTARDLRQSSPFAGTLTEPERRLVLDAVDETHA